MAGSRIRMQNETNLFNIRWFISFSCCMNLAILWPSAILRLNDRFEEIYATQQANGSAKISWCIYLFVVVAVRHRHFPLSVYVFPLGFSDTFDASPLLGSWEMIYRFVVGSRYPSVCKILSKTELEQAMLAVSFADGRKNTENREQLHKSQTIFMPTTTQLGKSIHWKCAKENMSITIYPK